MKKSLLALAVLGAFAGAAAAQTNVTLYGIADAGIGMADTDAVGGSNNVEVFSGVQSTSRFGVRGSEDLGGGLKATFNLEAGVDFGTGGSDLTYGVDTDYPTTSANINRAAVKTNTFWQRRAVVGLAGSFGEVRLGRDYTPGFLAAGVGDVMGYGLFGNWLTFTAQAGTNGVATRASNGLHYTGSFGGVTLRAMYATGEANDSVDWTYNDGTTGTPKGHGDAYGLSAVYAAGPLQVAAYYQVLETVDVVGGIAGTTTSNTNQWGIGGQYNFGMFRVSANYGVADPDNGVEHTGMGIGLGVKLGAGEVLAQYIQQDLDVAGGADPEGKSFGLAYVHPLSKRTNLYASYGKVKNDDGGRFGLRYSQSVVGAGGNDRDPSAFAVGIRHMF